MIFSIGDFTLHPVFIVIVFITAAILLITLWCSEEARRQWPKNLIFLTALTVCFGLIAGCMTEVFESSTVLTAVVLTAVIVILLTLLAFQSWVDATQWKPALGLVSTVYISANVIVLFAFTSEWQLYMACFGAAVCSLYIIYDTQIMIGELKIKKILKSVIFISTLHH